MPNYGPGAKPLIDEKQRKRLSRRYRKRVRREKETPRQKAKRLGVPYIGEDSVEREQKIKRKHIASVLPGVDEGDVKEVEDAIIGLPAGLFGIAKGAVQDINDLTHGRPQKARRTSKVGKEIAKATYRDLRHPLRNPLMTGLTVSGLASAGAGTATRGAAAAKAAKTGGLKGAAEAAAKRPSPGVRIHTYKGQEIRGRYSTAASSRGVQKAADRLRERRGAPLFSPKPKPGEKRSTISARKAERLLSEERRVTDAAAKAPHLRLLADAPRADKGVGRIVGRYRKFDGTAKDMAIRVAAEGVPLDDVIEAHVRAASQIEVRLKNRKKGGNPPPGTKASGVSMQGAFRLNRERRELLRKAAILEESRKHLDDVDGVPRVKPELERSYQLARESAKVREGRVKKAGLITLQQAESRTQAPGRAMVKTVSGGRAIKQERPRTVAEADAELSKLKGEIDRIVGPIIERHYQEDPDLWKLQAEQSRQVQGGGKQVPKHVPLPRRRASEMDKQGNFGQVNIQKADELAEYVEPPSGAAGPRHASGRAMAEADFWNKVAKSPHESAVRLRAMQDKADELEQAVTFHKEPAWMREEGDVAPDLGSVTEFKRFEDVEPFSGGEFRVPDVMVSGRIPHGPSAYRGGVPRKPGTLTHAYTGALRRSGKYTPHTRRAIAEDSLQAERYLSVERFRQRLLPMGEKVRPVDTRTTRYVPLRVDPLKKTEGEQLRKMLDEVDPELLTPDEAVRVEQAVKAFEAKLFPEEGRDIPFAAPGEAVNNVVWIDKTLLGSQRKLIGRLPVYDVTADAVKGLILYGKPGYVTPNVLGNAALNTFQQGVLAPANWARAVRLPRDVGFLIDEVMGHGFSRALAEGTSSRISGAVQKGGNFWSYFVDTPFRRAAFIHEARRMGYKTPEQYRQLIMDSRRRPEYAEIAQRARDQIIDYERLGPLERDLVRRALFVYPWVKGSTYYAGQFLRDHPILAATFAKIGEQGMERSQEELGRVPSWARGSFKVGGTQERPLIVNPSAVSPFQTPAQVAATLRGATTGSAERSEQLGEMANPVLQSGLEAAFGRELFTGRELRGPLPNRFVGQTLKGLPQYLLQKRLREADDPETANRTYPYSKGEALGQFVVGSSFPRPANLQALNEQAVQARTPAQKAKRTIDRERDEMVALYKEVYPEALDGDKLPAPIAKAFTRRQTVEQARTAAETEFEPGRDRDAAKLVREIDLAVKWRLVEEPVARKMKRFAKTASHDAIREERDWITSHWFDDAYLGALRDERKWLEERR